MLLNFIFILFMYSCENNPARVKLEDSSSIEGMTAEDRAVIIEEAKTRVPTCTYCRYNVEHVFKTIKERETHEEGCPERAAYERKAAQTSEIYNRHKNYI